MENEVCHRHVLLMPALSKLIEEICRCRLCAINACRIPRKTYLCYFLFLRRVAFTFGVVFRYFFTYVIIHLSNTVVDFDKLGF